MLDVGKSDAFGPVKLMGTAGCKLQRCRREVQLEVGHGLHRIAVKQGSVRACDLREVVQVDEVSDLVVGVHQTDQGFAAGLSVCGKLCLEPIQIMVAMGVKRYGNCLNMLGQGLDHVGYSMVF